MRSSRPQPIIQINIIRCRRGSFPKPLSFDNRRLMYGHDPTRAATRSSAVLFIEILHCRSCTRTNAHIYILKTHTLLTPQRHLRNVSLRCPRDTLETRNDVPNSKVYPAPFTKQGQLPVASLSSHFIGRDGPFLFARSTAFTQYVGLEILKFRDTSYNSSHLLKCWYLLGLYGTR